MAPIPPADRPRTSLLNAAGSGRPSGAPAPDGQPRTRATEDVFAGAPAAAAAAPAPPTGRPLSVDDPAAQAAIAKVRASWGIRGASEDLQPLSVEVDSLGLTHVRMQRLHNGLPVLDDQVVGHLDRTGQLVSGSPAPKAIDAGLGASAAPRSGDDAIASAMAAYGRGRDELDGPPSATRVVARDAEGQYRDVYRIQTSSLAGPAPERMNFLVDATSGQVVDRWNDVAAFLDADEIAGLKAAHAAQAPTFERARAPVAGGAPVHVEQSAECGAAIEDYAVTRWRFDVDQAASVDSLKLTVDLDHENPRELFCELIGPSGKRAIFAKLSASEGGLKATYDLSSQFKGEDARGAWTVVIYDQGMGSKGTLNRCALSIDGTAKDAASALPLPEGANDRTMYNGTVAISDTKLPDGTYELRDTTRGQGIETVDSTRIPQQTEAVKITDNNGIWGENTDSQREWSAVDAQFAAQMTYDFYRDILGRDSIDGKGMRLINNVHFSRLLINAYWDNDTKRMLYGDANGEDCDPLTTLDIAGHEISHGLTLQIAGLGLRGQPGAVNESMSDILGTGVEWYAKKRYPQLKADPSTLVEQAWSPLIDGDALRYMNQPSRDGASIDALTDFKETDRVHGVKGTDVHEASGIMNNAFWLFVHGGEQRTTHAKVDGMAKALGADAAMEKGLKIFGGALHYMVPTTDFRGARVATIKSAIALYGPDSFEVQQLKNAWSACRVEDPLPAS